MNKNVYVVLGMSRSGTSAIARSLKVLNIDLGDKLLPGDSRNPKGFYEDSDILYKVNRGVSAITGDLWENTGVLNAKFIENSAPLQEFKAYAQKLLAERFANTDHWGFKDPRTITILPFWQSVFTAMQLEDRYVLTVRNPLAAAHSNFKFTNLDIEMGLLLWLVIMINSIEQTQGKKRAIVSFEAMLENPKLQLERMHKAFAFPFALDAKECDVYANEFLDKKLSHHEFTTADLQTHPTMATVPLCLRVYDVLMRLASDELVDGSAEFYALWNEIKQEFARSFPLYQYVDKQDKRTRNAERELKAIRKSVLWKMIYPLRIVDDALRARRHQARQKKKSLGNAYG